MDVPFGARVFVLALVAAALSTLDFCRRGRQSTAYQEYGIVFIAGILGAFVGAANDAITSNLSPEYFVYGKGLPEGNGLRIEAIEYGLKVGFSGGIICGAILVYVGRRKSKTPPVGFVFLLQHLWIPVIGAIAGALILPAMASRFDPMNLGKQLESIVPHDRIASFLRVWWIHAGIYSGLLAGLITLNFVVVRRRSACAGLF